MRSATAPPLLALSGLYSYLFAGVGFVRRNPAILVSRCYWAGATALLPIYARDILHTGLGGLGVLRGAPAVGALLMAAALTRRPISRRVGMRMLQAVIVFGAAAVLFALSILALARRAAGVAGIVIRIAGAAADPPTRGAGGRRGELSVRQCILSARRVSKAALRLGSSVPCPPRPWAGIGTIVVALILDKIVSVAAQCRAVRIADASMLR